MAAQKAEVESSLTKAEQAEEEGRKLLYTTDMRLAPFVWGDDRSGRRNFAPCWRDTFPKAAAQRTRTHLPLTKSPICAASSGTTTSTCWKVAPRSSRGMPPPWPTALSPRMANW